LSYTDPVTGRSVAAGYLELTLLALESIGCLNQASLALEPFRSRLAGFDALATLAIWHYAPGNRDVPYYPWHRAYEGPLYEPSIALLLQDPDLRAAVFPDTDEALATVLLDLERFSRQNMAVTGGGWPYANPTIMNFVAAERQRQHRADLLKSVLHRAKAISERLPVSQQGHGPTIVTYSDGSTNQFVRDPATVQRLAEDGVINPRATGTGPPPKLLRKWSTDELQAWLDEN
jgi:hypothetical protein